MKNVTAAIVAAMIAFGPGAVFAFADLADETSPAFAAADAEGGKICPSCGAANIADAVYCNKCGKKFREVETDFEFCPYCGEKIRPSERVCPSCGRKITAPTVSDTRRVWERRTCGFALAAGGDISEDTDIYLAGELAFNIADYLAFGPELSYAPGGEYNTLLFGGGLRAYLIPYSRGYFIKPYINFRSGLDNRKDRYDGWRYYMFYYGAGAGADFRITGSSLVIFVGVGFRVRRNAQETKDTYFTPTAGLRVLL